MDVRKGRIGIGALILSLFVAMVSCEDVKFFYTVQGGTVQCFLQNVQMDHVGQFMVKSESSNIIMSVNDPKGRELAKEMGQKKMQAKFDAEQQGQYQVCVQNKEDGDVSVEITIQTGEFSNMYMQNQKIMKKHLKPVEMQAFKVNEMVS